MNDYRDSEKYFVCKTDMAKRNKDMRSQMQKSKEAIDG
jgi:hypothetical protein